MNQYAEQMEIEKNAREKKKMHQQEEIEARHRAKGLAIKQQRGMTAERRKGNRQRVSWEAWMRMS
jgi:hypothetical protein